jgi:hypothetical protein
VIKLRLASLPLSAGNALKALQSQIDACSSYAERISHARQRFDNENRPGNAAFDAVKITLASMCSGACRCMYCEDSCASEIEHFCPKSFYPDLVFAWLNYLYSCGPCNRTKLNHFRILSTAGEFVDLFRRRGGSVVEPAAGSPVLLNPRVEDPLAFLSLDLVDTFHFVPRHAKDTLEHARAQYTIMLLKLNAREILPVARREAYLSYRARLHEYVDIRGSLASDHLAEAIRRCGHPTVWVEMKAQAHLIADLKPLFEAAPEALAW